MAWIIFDEADHYTPAPNFCLAAQDGRQVCLRDYQEDCSLVLLIAQEQTGEVLRTAVEAFNERLGGYRGFDAKVLAVISGSGSSFPERLDEVNPGYPLLDDSEGKVRRAYAGLMDASLVKDEDLLVFVLDRYNAPYAAWIGKEFNDPAVHQEVQSWLAYIGVQCPE